MVGSSVRGKVAEALGDVSGCGTYLAWLHFKFACWMDARRQLFAHHMGCIEMIAFNLQKDSNDMLISLCMLYNSL